MTASQAQSGGLLEFMDEQAGREPGPGPADLGPASRQLSVALDPDRAASVVHFAVWSRILNEPLLRRTLGLPQRGQPSDSGQSDRPIVVAHAGGTRLDLLVLTDDGPELPRALEVNRRTRSALVDPPRDTQPLGRRVGMSLYASGYVVDPSVIDRAVVELVSSDAPLRAVAARTPRLDPTASVSHPALPVFASSAGGLGDATVGLLSVDPADGRWHATTACHAVPEGASWVTVEGVPAEVVARNPSSDLCVLRIEPNGQLYRRLRSVRRVSRRPPRLNWPATFDGITSGQRTTPVRGADPNIQIVGWPYASFIYTDNDTVEGDSGAVLLDEDQDALGFAAFRTAYGQEPAMSVWVWAAHALDSLGFGEF